MKQKHEKQTRREMKQVKFYITEEEKKVLADAAKARGYNRQELFEQWVESLRQ